MRIYELFEGESDQSAEIVIQRRIKLLKDFLTTIDNVIHVYGYDKTLLLAKKTIQNSESLDWMLKGSVVGNPKLEKSFNKLLQLRQEIINKINSGL